ncbi:1-acyl-sn-glycerol-3-phosphate acyltransferase [Spirochaeta africana]|uniref:1-acyl-sn-glycerol-3-phosphate acyltransferase n=1 Tax=Spirochaeta africana (strain ATCC 700263 / DSM 8902 / Z-7692) TaxID=889378 RepID=H9ULC8_SPIAZ|nr:1-acyl-sn-glycerol-3-phosphate acyltransferase [Spirochaeta africana]AFG38321.1 1-acyl-sn-glycerol-3-phosphate acyltransferase [Spirochaeta africana DSM 8902]
MQHAARKGQSSHDQESLRAARSAAKRLLNRAARFGLRMQALLARLFLPLLYPTYHILLRFVLGYSMPGYRKVRADIRKAVGRKRRPLLICPNHLTMIDSIILMWALTPWWRTFWDLRFFSWNTPEKTNFAHIPVLRFFTYIGKCIEVVRRAPREETQKLLAKLKLLLASGQSLMIFPEGKRSRTGRVDTEDYAYGVGKLIQDLYQMGAEPEVLCLYLRGEHQDSYSTIPVRGERFHLSFRLIQPHSEQDGLRAHRDISRQIITQLTEMEDEYFAAATETGQ